MYLILRIIKFLVSISKHFGPTRNAVTGHRDARLALGPADPMAS